MVGLVESGQIRSGGVFRREGTAQLRDVRRGQQKMKQHVYHHIHQSFSCLQKAV